MNKLLTFLIVVVAIGSVTCAVLYDNYKVQQNLAKQEALSQQWEQEKKEEEARLDKEIKERIANRTLPSEEEQEMIRGYYQGKANINGCTSTTSPASIKLSNGKRIVACIMKAHDYRKGDSISVYKNNVIFAEQ